LGTPSALVGTNITGTAAGLTAGNVTTNANLTGAVTSVGNATSLGSFTSAQLATALTDETGTGVAVFATSPTLVTPALGTPSSGVVTNLTGTASININGTVGASTPSTGAFTSLSASGATTLSGGTANGVTYLNGSKVLTSGSALTFDGTNLGLSGTGARYINLGTTSTSGQSVALQISAPNNDASPSVYRIGSGLTANNELVAYDVTNAHTVDKYIRGASGFRAFYHNGSEQMRLTSTGLGIGTTTPAVKLDVVGAISATTNITTTANLVLGNSSNQANINMRGGAATSNQYNLLSDTSGRLYINNVSAGTIAYFSAAAGLAVTGAISATTGSTFRSAGYGVAATFYSAASDIHGEIQFNGGDGWFHFGTVSGHSISFKTGNVRRAVLTSGGLAVTGAISATEIISANKGITFPATQVASADANTLDDYEEGTWTPSLLFGGGNTGQTGTYVGKYTKVGNLVTAHATIFLSAKGSSTGAVTVGGLPFVSANLSTNYVAVTLWAGTVSFADMLIAYNGPNTTVLTIQQITNAGADSGLSNANFSNASQIMVAVTYTV